MSTQTDVMPEADADSGAAAELLKRSRYAADADTWLNLLASVISMELKIMDQVSSEWLSDARFRGRKRGGPDGVDES